MTTAPPTSTDDEPTVRPYGHRFVTTRRVEFVVPASGTDVPLTQLQRVVAHASLWLSTEYPDVDQAGLAVRYGHDQALVVSCEVDVADHASPHGPATLITDVLETQRFQLAEALDVADDVTWDYLLDVVRNRTALTNVAARAVQAVNGDALVLALLPRDWPRQLEQQVTDAGNLLGLVGLIKRLVDDWVLAATDVVDACGVEPEPLRTAT